MTKTMTCPCGSKKFSVGEPKTKPIFQHDCGKCRFIGHFHKHDIYLCKGSGSTHIVARYGNDGPEYASDFIQHLQESLVSDFRCVHSSDGKIHTGEPLDYQIAMTMGAAAAALLEQLAFESSKPKSRERSRPASTR